MFLLSKHFCTASSRVHLLCIRKGEGWEGPSPRDLLFPLTFLDFLLLFFCKREERGLCPLRSPPLLPSSPLQQGESGRVERKRPAGGDTRERHRATNRRPQPPPKASRAAAWEKRLARLKERRGKGEGRRTLGLAGGRV